MPTHKLKSGESLVSLARENKFNDWHLIYDHEGNQALREKREHPNALREGDEVFVPERTVKPQTYATGSRHQVKLILGRGVWDLKWSADKAVCGDKLTLVGETNLPDGDLELKLVGRELPSPKLPKPKLSIKAGKLSFTWDLKDVEHLTGDKPPSAFDDVHIEATTKDDGLACNLAVVTVRAVGRAPVKTFDATRSWNGFTNHSHFTAKLEKFVCVIGAKPKVLKGWGGTYVDLRSAGITGTAGGCPWAGHRWARPKGMSMVPAEYHNGTAWVPLPAGFTPSATNYQAVGFYRSGTKFVGASGGTWPEAFADYDFNGNKYKKVREKWSKQAHDQWSDKFLIERQGCKSDKSVTCCRYKVEMTLTFAVVATYGNDVVLFAPGNLRSNAGLWFMGDTSNMAAHETGHHLDNPDEYAGGAVDTTLSGDGAVNGIDADSIMGQNMTKTKKRHYHAFAKMTAKLVNGASGRSDKYKVVDK